MTTAREKRLREIRSIGKRLFGIDSLRKGQEQALLALTGGHDVLAVLPTGSGKSAIYQIAAAVIRGPTIVVSPLIALQREQAGRLAGEETGGAAILNSMMRVSERRAAYDGLERAGLEFLFLAPEQLQRPEVLERLREAKPTLFVVDEAHCISEWGHDFRPDYLALGDAIEALGRPRTLALTATASSPVREEIVDRLGMRKPKVVAGDMDRPNIWLEVVAVKDVDAKRRRLLFEIEGEQKPGIVYVATQRRAEEVAALLGENGIAADFYHGGLARGERESAQEAFMRGATDVMVATPAFGMGIDKPDVRFVYHYDCSDSLDAYYQQIGRAGRDGEPAKALLLYRPEDLAIYKFFAAGGGLKTAELESLVAALRDGERLDNRKLAERTELSRLKLSKAAAELLEQGVAERRADGTLAVVVAEEDIDVSRVAEEAKARARRNYERLLRRLDGMRIYAETVDCRRQYLLEYFAQAADPCGRCDNCMRAPERASSSLPFPIKGRVSHAELGEGIVLGYEGPRLRVLFDEAGEKIFNTKYVTARNLIVRSH
ncbi:MAG TPA: RecQ family ATP-dependent DNA helicase [Gammaproteobacteria bacterium]|nr:RecQ family ATP-dependent DNA helicase [Gammaproteobacteria bacterium]